MWPSCYIFDVYGVNFRDTVHLRVLAEGLNHLSAFAGSLEEFSRSSENCPEEMEPEKLGFQAAVYYWNISQKRQCEFFCLYLKIVRLY